MKILNFLRCEEERALAAELASRLSRDLPVRFLESNTKQLSVNKITRSLERIYQDAVAKNAKRKMGVYRRSVLANSFKWALKEGGYSDEFINVATEGLVMELAKAQK